LQTFFALRFKSDRCKKAGTDNSTGQDHTRVQNKGEDPTGQLKTHLMATSNSAFISNVSISAD
jgi:hypothetical protein